jgi:hypothetical protein
VRRTRALLFGVLLALVPSTPAVAAAAEVVATLDGRAIAIAEIADHYCHDFEFPVIRCFSRAAARDLSRSVPAGPQGAAAVTAVAYVTMYDGAGFSGSNFLVSQDYNALAAIGWNDRASSFKGRNSETGRFYKDWFAGGSSWAFCCNQQTGNLGTYDNTFSSVYRT